MVASPGGVLLDEATAAVGGGGGGAAAAVSVPLHQGVDDDVLLEPEPLAPNAFLPECIRKAFSTAPAYDERMARKTSRVQSVLAHAVRLGQTVTKTLLGMNPAQWVRCCCVQCG